MPRITSVATATPGHRLAQAEARAFAEEFFSGSDLDLTRMLAVFDNAGIEMRYVCMPPEWFRTPHPFDEKNRLYIEWATRLGAEAAHRCLDRAGLDAAELTHIIFVSTTGLATPSIDSRLINVLELDPHIRRMPLWGLGCGGGAAGIAHAAELAIADPRARVLLVAVELCSLTFNHADMSKANLVATALFADGAGAVLVSGDEHGSDGLAILGTRSTTWPGSLDVMGWNFDSAGMQVIFSLAIPSIVREKARPDMTDFLAGSGMEVGDLRHLIAHPGGVKVIEAYEEALELGPQAMSPTRASLRSHGNMSSASVLFVLERFIQERILEGGERVVLTALGPGFTAHHVLVRQG